MVSSKAKTVSIVFRAELARGRAGCVIRQKREPRPSGSSSARTLVANSASGTEQGFYPMLTGSVCIASNTRAAMNTLQTVAPIPAFKAGSIPWLRRRADLTLVALVFAGIRFSAVCLVQPSKAILKSDRKRSCDGNHILVDFILL